MGKTTTLSGENLTQLQVGDSGRVRLGAVLILSYDLFITLHPLPLCLEAQIDEELTHEDVAFETPGTTILDLGPSIDTSIFGSCRREPTTEPFCPF